MSAVRADRATPAWTGRRRFRVTREGKYFLLITVGLGIAAVNTGNNLMFLVLGLLLSLILLSGILSDLTLYRVDVERALARRAFAGAPCAATIVVHNRKRRVASYSLRLAERDLGAAAAGFVLKVPPRAERRVRLAHTPRQRGWLTLTGLTVTTSHPFGLIEKTALVALPARLLVYPALAPSSQRGVVERLTRPRPDHIVARLGRGTEVAGLRDYQPGDEARGIHWHRSAALGRLVTRERWQESAARLVIEVDNVRPPDAGAGWGAAFERAVSEAAWLATFAAGRGLQVQVRARGGGAAAVVTGPSAEPAWRFLAELGPAPGAAALPPARRPPRGEHVVVCTP